jgi:hypothetical protein
MRRERLPRGIPFQDDDLAVILELPMRDERDVARLAAGGLISATAG